MEKKYTGMSGYLFLLLELLILILIVFGFIRMMIIPSILLIPVFILIAVGFTVVDPNQSCVMILFGAYKGTIKTNGFYWVNPFFVRKKISLRARNFDSRSFRLHWGADTRRPLERRGRRWAGRIRGYRSVDRESRPCSVATERRRAGSCSPAPCHP